MSPYLCSLGCFAPGFAARLWRVRAVEPAVGKTTLWTPTELMTRLYAFIRRRSLCILRHGLSNLET